MKRLLMGTAVAAVSLASAPAGAAVFSFAFIDDASSTLDAMGTITTSDTAGLSGGFDVLGITGTVNGSTITGVQEPTAYYGDNILYTGTPHVDYSGIVFDAGSTVYKIYHTTSYYLYNATSGAFPGTSGRFGITPLASGSAVPEPATWAMLAGGLALIGVGARSSRRRGAAFAV